MKINKKTLVLLAGLVMMPLNMNKTMRMGFIDINNDREPDYVRFECGNMDFYHEIYRYLDSMDIFRLEIYTKPRFAVEGNKLYIDRNYDAIADTVMTIKDKEDLLEKIIRYNSPFLNLEE